MSAKLSILQKPHLGNQPGRGLAKDCGALSLQRCAFQLAAMAWRGLVKLDQMGEMAEKKAAEEMKGFSRSLLSWNSHWIINCNNVLEA